MPVRRVLYFISDDVPGKEVVKTENALYRATQNKRVTVKSVRIALVQVTGMQVDASLLEPQILEYATCQ
jgi:hypothetical protein